MFSLESLKWLVKSFNVRAYCPVLTSYSPIVGRSGSRAARRSASPRDPMQTGTLIISSLLDDRLEFWILDIMLSILKFRMST